MNPYRRKKTRTELVFFVSLCLIFLLSISGSSTTNAQTKAFGEAPKKEVERKPKLIVLPFRQAQENSHNKTGLAVHFLLGNVVALYPDLKEFWFGWRAKKIFLEREAFRAYSRGVGPQLDLLKLGEQQDIRYWLSGEIKRCGTRTEVPMILTDTELKHKRRSTTLTLDISGHLMSFRKGFLAWMEKCGFPLTAAQAKMALWPEKSNPEGLDILGSALENYYLHFSWGEEAPICLYWFDKAVSAAPSSYLAHDIQGWALYKNKDYNAAQESFRTALSLNPHGLGAISGMMWCSIYRHDEDAARSWALIKADIRRESREKAKALVNRRIKKLTGKIKD